MTAGPIENPGVPEGALPARWFCIVYAPANPSGVMSILGPVPEGWDPSVLP